MRTRIISSIVGLALLFYLVFKGHFTLGIGIFILALVGLYEFYNTAEKIGYKPIRIIGYISCLSIVMLGLIGDWERVKRYMPFFNLKYLKSTYYFSLWVFLMVLAMLVCITFLYNRFNFTDISITIFGILYVVFLFSFILLTRNLDKGYIYIWLIFIGAWVTDSFAYFIGIAVGKHKLCPAVSPKKTVEGAIGGVLGCVLLTSVFGMYISNCYPHIKIGYFHYIVLGALNGTISQVGDLTASAIKRYAGVKDYGKLIPGHGGVLDRFDSILLIAPVVYFYITLFVVG